MLVLFHAKITEPILMKLDTSIAGDLKIALSYFLSQRSDGIGNYADETAWRS